MIPALWTYTFQPAEAQLGTGAIPAETTADMFDLSSCQSPIVSLGTKANIQSSLDSTTTTKGLGFVVIEFAWFLVTALNSSGIPTPLVFLKDLTPRLYPLPPLTAPAPGTDDHAPLENIYDSLWETLVDDRKLPKLLSPHFSKIYKFSTAL
ncbi:hypothetical protein NE237_012331 [Protea cynaroides]|uniref:Uncharacterized protein n=1 Tax=Protea cynaroides TaxID=273540 RepID=A0A9Q0JZ50_9MAGN|nr:hypothetical protein NE237_012331 [Protea cynaroides]